MATKFHFAGGPYQGRDIDVDNAAPQCALPVDEALQPVTGGDPYALAIYQADQDLSTCRYQFRGFVRANQKPFLARFEGGPIEGSRPVQQPGEYGPNTVIVPLGEDGGTQFHGLPAAVAIYSREQRGTEYVYVFSRTEDSGETFDSAVLERQKSIGKQIAQQFYDNPDYSIYTKPPTGEHVQVAIQHASRRAEVDERVSELVVELWKRNLETAGSCQERADNGKAYVGFPVPGEGEVFYEFLRERGFDANLKAKKTQVRNPGTGEVLELPTANVHFSSGDIDLIVQALRQPRA